MRSLWCCGLCSGVHVFGVLLTSCSPQWNYQVVVWCATLKFFMRHCKSVGSCWVFYSLTWKKVWNILESDKSKCIQLTFNYIWCRMWSLKACKVRSWSWSPFHCRPVTVPLSVVLRLPYVAVGEGWLECCQPFLPWQRVVMNLDWVLLGFWSCSLPSHAVSFLSAALRVVLVLKGVHSNKVKNVSTFMRLISVGMLLHCFLYFRMLRYSLRKYS